MYVTFKTRCESCGVTTVMSTREGATTAEKKNTVEKQKGLWRKKGKIKLNCLLFIEQKSVKPLSSFFFFSVLALFDFPFPDFGAIFFGTAKESKS